MKKLIVIALFFISVQVLAATDTATEAKPVVNENNVTESTKSFFSGVVGFGKGVVDGTIDGINQGLSEKNKSLTVSDASQAASQLQMKVLAVDPIDSEQFSVVIGFKNLTDKPMKITSLTDTNKLIAVDKDDYVINLAGNGANPSDLALLPKLGKKQKFVFAGKSDCIKEVRLLGKELKVSQSLLKQTSCYF